jgi:hypothetical protein
VPFNVCDNIFHASLNVGLLLALFGIISVMDVDPCFEPSQVVWLSLNAKVDLHDLVLPMTMSLDELTKAGHARGGQ